MPPTSFEGREAELAAWSELLRQPATRLLTLTGMGGIGKTRSARQLALCVGNAAPANFPHGVCWVGLEEARSGEAMIGRIADEMGLYRQKQPSRQEQLWAFLRPRRLLLILDNLEQIADAPQVVARLLEHAPHLKCVATSRSALNVQAEVRLEVPPLSSREAARLFVKRALARDPGLKLSEADVDVQKLCEGLEGVPLAIEMAASRGDLFTPREIFNRLDKRLDLLKISAPDLSPHRRALRATMDWSYDLLDEMEQAVFAQLAVFVGGFTLPAVEAVCNTATSESLLESVEALCRHSLLRSRTNLNSQEKRFVMLDSVRAYAEEKLHATPQVEESLRRRHAVYFWSFAEERIEQLRTERESRVLKKLEVEAANLRAATDWACERRSHLSCARLSLALGTFLQRRGWFFEAVRRFETGLKAVQRLPKQRSLAARLWLERAGMYLDQHEWEKAHEAATEAGLIFGALSDLRGVAQCDNLRGSAAKGAKDYKTARTFFTSALEGFRQAADQIGEAKVLNNLGLLEYEKEDGNRLQAAQHLKAALQLLRRHGDTRGTAGALNNLGALAYQQSDDDGAWRYYLEALELQKDSLNVWGVGCALFNLGEVAERRGQQGRSAEIRRARRLFAAAECSFENVGSPLKDITEEFRLRAESALASAGETPEKLPSKLYDISLDDLINWSLAELDLQD